MCFLRISIFFHCKFTLHVGRWWEFGLALLGVTLRGLGFDCIFPSLLVYRRGLGGTMHHAPHFGVLAHQKKMLVAASSGTSSGR